MLKQQVLNQVFQVENRGVFLCSCGGKTLISSGFTDNFSRIFGGSLIIETLCFSGRVLQAAGFCSHRFEEGFLIENR